MNTKYAEQAKKIFEMQPDNMLVHFTADGRPFTIKNHAENHSLMLDDKTIYTYGREDVVMSERILNENPDVKARGLRPGDTIAIGDNIPGATKVIDQVDVQLAKLHKAEAEKLDERAILTNVQQVGGPTSTETKEVEALKVPTELTEAEKQAALDKAAAIAAEQAKAGQKVETDADVKVEVKVDGATVTADTDTKPAKKAVAKTATK